MAYSRILSTDAYLQSLEEQKELLQDKISNLEADREELTDYIAQLEELLDQYSISYEKPEGINIYE